MMKGQ